MVLGFQAVPGFPKASRPSTLFAPLGQLFLQEVVKFLHGIDLGSLC